MASKSRITRRGLLRFAGSTSVMAALSPFVPVLESDVEAAGGVPIRLILMYWPVGTDYVNFLCGGGQTDFELSPSLSSLEPHRDKLLILQGIDNQAARLSLSDGGHRGIHSIWTGQPNGEGNFSGGGTPHNFGWPVGISVDQYLAQEIGKTETWRFSSIEASTNTDPYAAPWNNRMSFSGPQEPVPTEDDPREVWKRLFADLDIDPAQYEQFRAAKQSVIDVVKDDVARLQAKVGAADRHKIDRHLENLRSVEERILSSGQQCDEVPAQPPNVGNQEIDERFASTKLQVDNLVQAFKCGLTRVGSLLMGQETRGFGNGHHSWSHSGANADRSNMRDITRQYCEMLTHMIESLEAVPEGSGTMLDNSIVVWASGISESTSHNNHSVPLVIAGSGGGYLKQGVKFQWGDYGLSGDISERYDSFGGRHNNDLLVSLCNAMGHPVDSFGAQEYNQGPLDEIEA